MFRVNTASIVTNIFGDTKNINIMLYQLAHILLDDFLWLYIGGMRHYRRLFLSPEFLLGEMFPGQDRRHRLAWKGYRHVDEPCDEQNRLRLGYAHF